MFGMFPSRGVWRRPGLHPVDLLVFAALLALLFGLLRLAPALNAPFLPKTAPSTVSTDPANLPYYAVRSLLRMFIALILSVLFTFVYATAAARLRRAEKVLVPVLDILQSVPVLGFLAVTVTAFINLFPGSELGLEWASIFAIFTSMAWNMTFAFYHSLISQPRDLDEAARIMRLTKWERFWRLDVPSGMIPLVWNGMLVDAAVMLGLARVRNAQLEITDAGREFARADIDTSKKLFGELIAARAPLIKAILRALRATQDGTLREGFFLDLLRRGFSAEEARRQLDIAIDWGRYGELFEYDAEDGQLVLGSDPEKVGV